MIAAIVCRGFGPAASIALVVTRGYAISAVVVVLPDPGDVRFGIVYDASNLPAPGDVRLGVVYG